MSIEAAWVENRPSEGARALRPGQLWEYRELLLFLALRDIKSRYKQAFFGFGWAILQPAAGVVVLALVFRRLTGVSSGSVPYPVFALIGFSVWSYFSSTVTGEIASLVGNASLVTKVYFPRLVAPLAALLPNLIGLGLSLGLILVVMGLYGIAPPAAIAALPACVIALLLASLGPGLLLATLNVKYRDVGSLLGPLTQLWLFASPVAYPSTLIAGGWRWLYALNPLVGVIGGFRWAFTSVPVPAEDLAASAASTLVLLVAGLRYFQRSERAFADVI